MTRVPFLNWYQAPSIWTLRSSVGALILTVQELVDPVPPPFLRAVARNSSRTLATKLWVGHAQASPKAQIVRPAMLSATLLRVSVSCSTPPPWSIRSVIFFIQRDPSRHGVHWPQLSCA